MNRAMTTGLAARSAAEQANRPDARAAAGPPPSIALLTGGDDRPYALGMAEALKAQGIRHDFIGSDQLDAPQLHDSPLVTFLNFRGDQRENSRFPAKLARILRYYRRLVAYAVSAEPELFHILWNNKFEIFDRTLLMLWYRVWGRQVILTAHNVNAAKRDSRDSALNRLTLGAQYRLCRHILVHTALGKRELVGDFGVAESKVTIIPFGINDTIPKTSLRPADARAQLGIGNADRVILFFGQIAPYKGLEYLVEALSDAQLAGHGIHLLIAGKVKRGHESYWERIRETLASLPLPHRVTTHVRFVPDDQVERYFKAADLVVLPYTAISQSGVPFLAFSFGLPVVATDVGSLREDIRDGITGYVCPPRDPSALASTIARYFASDMYRFNDERREAIRTLAMERHSWETVGHILSTVYESARAHR